MERFFDYLAMVLIGQYVLRLSANGQLAFYIHPRYFQFTTIAAAIVLVVGITGMMHSAFRIYRKGNLRPNLRFRLLELFSSKVILNVIIWGVIILSFIVPPMTLSTRAAAQRVSTNNIAALDQSAAVTSFASRRDQYEIGEWVAQLQRDPRVEKYEGDTVNVSGFIFLPEGTPAGQFEVSRFVIRCCVVDATPLGLSVVYDWEQEFSESDWVSISGEFEIINENGEQKLVIIPKTIKLQEVPEFPYIY